MQNGNGPIGIVDVSPNGNHAFSAIVSLMLGIKPIETKVKKFSDGEVDIDIDGSVRGTDVFLFQSYVAPVGERKYEFENTVSAARSGGGARRITAVWPYCFGMRGERQTRPRQSVPIEVWARSAYAMGVEQIVTVGLHTDVIKTIFRAVGERGGIKVEDLPFEPLAANYIMQSAIARDLTDIVVASPDSGGTKRAEKVLELIAQNSSLRPDLAIGHKYRSPDEQTTPLRLVGDVAGKSVFIYDDIAGTLGTIEGATRMVEDAGAKDITLLFIHPVLGKGYEESLERLAANPKIREIVFGNSIPLKSAALNCPKVREIPLEPFVAEAIRRLNANESMSDLHKYGTIVEIYERMREEGVSPRRFDIRQIG